MLLLSGMGRPSLCASVMPFRQTDGLGYVEAVDRWCCPFSVLPLATGYRMACVDDWIRDGTKCRLWSLLWSAS